MPRPRLAREHAAAVVTERHYALLAAAINESLDAALDEDVEQRLAAAIAAGDRASALAALPDADNPRDARSLAMFRRMLAPVLRALAIVSTEAANAIARREELPLTYVLPEEIITKAARKPKRKPRKPVAVTTNLVKTRQQAAQLVLRLAREQRAVAREVLGQRWDPDRRPATLVKELKQRMGLSRKDSAALTAKRKEVESSKLTPRQRERAIAEHAVKLRTQRVAREARTAAVAAETDAKIEAWLDARDEGLLGGKPEKEWVASADACETCARMDGERVALDEQFRLPDTSRVDGPPAHPNCECSAILRRGRL